MAGLVGVLIVVAAGGLALCGWSAEMWNGALTWPPMIIGGVAMSVAATWIGRAAATGLTAANPVRRAEPEQAADETEPERRRLGFWVGRDRTRRWQRSEAERSLAEATVARQTSPSQRMWPVGQA